MELPSGTPPLLTALLPYLQLTKMALPSKGKMGVSFFFIRCLGGYGARKSGMSVGIVTEYRREIILSS